MKKIFAVMALLSVTSAAFSATVWHGSTVKSVYPQSDGSLILIFNTDSAACTSASSPNYYYVTVGQNGVTEQGSNKIYAAALSAGHAGNSISFAFDDSTSNCYINRFLVDF